VTTGRISIRTDGLVNDMKLFVKYVLKIWNI
jgi:hypothetical protein